MKLEPIHFDTEPRLGVGKVDVHRSVSDGDRVLGHGYGKPGSPDAAHYPLLQAALGVSVLGNSSGENSTKPSQGSFLLTPGLVEGRLHIGELGKPAAERVVERAFGPPPWITPGEVDDGAGDRHHRNAPDDGRVLLVELPVDKDLDPSHSRSHRAGYGDGLFFDYLTTNELVPFQDCAVEPVDSRGRQPRGNGEPPFPRRQTAGDGALLEGARVGRMTVDVSVERLPLIASKEIVDALFACPCFERLRFGDDSVLLADGGVDLGVALSAEIVVEPWHAGS